MKTLKSVRSERRFAIRMVGGICRLEQAEAEENLAELLLLIFRDLDLLLDLLKAPGLVETNYRLP